MLELHRKLHPTIDSNYTPVWLSLKKWFHYDTTATIIGCSNYARRIDFVHCGYTFGARRFACRDPLCPLCSFNIYSKPLFEEFGRDFVSDVQVFYIVLSLSRLKDERSRLICRDADGSDLVGIKRRIVGAPCPPEAFGVEFKTQADLQQIRTWWRIIRQTVRKFVTKGRRRGFRGALGGPEIAVQFTPLRVLPHANVILWADSFTPEDARQLRRLITRRVRDSSQFRLLPCVACYRLASPNDVRQVLKYSFKAIDLAGEYVRSAELANYEPGAMTALNREVNTFLRLLPDVFHGVRRVERFGGCHFGADGYFGVVTPRRAARRDRDAQRRAALRTNGSLPKPHVKNSSHKHRRSKASRFTYWRAAVMPGPPPAPPGAPRKTPQLISPARVGLGSKEQQDQN